ncbi:MAG: DUF1552 domain-containing protein [Myxococcales bacterium]|nr:DUF1552 domain-containing protein [Myxococcales bacterium]
MQPLSRRRLLVGAGASLIAAPFFSMLSSSARADTSKTAKRLAIFFSPNGTVLEHWRPTGSGKSFDFPAGSILEPLQSLKQKLLVCDGIDFKNASNHEGGMAAMLTGGGDASSPSQGMSVDQYVARAIGAESRFASLELGVQTSAWGGNVQTRMSYGGAGQFVPPDDSPTSVFSRLFGDVSAEPSDLDRVQKRRKSVLDLVRGELGDLRQRVGGVEAQKLDAHLEALRSVEKGVQGPGSCTPSATPEALDPYGGDAFPALAKQQMDLLVTAFSCGMTNVGSIQMSHTVGPPVFSWLGLSEGHHSLSHMDDSNTQGVADFVTAERWFAEQFAYFLSALDNLQEPGGDGTLLDNTLVVWAKELGDSRLHECVNVPFILAGGGGRFELGRYLKFDSQPHTKLLVSICQALGLDNQTFGDPSHGTGPLEGLA